LISIRDAALAYLNEEQFQSKATKLLDYIHTLVFSDSKAGQEWLENAAIGILDGSQTW